MDYTILGRTGLRTSVMGLGCGGHSRLGLSAGKSEENAIGIVREALALGVNFIDTAEGYGTEPVVGKALAAEGVVRAEVILSTKASPRIKDRRARPEEMRARVDASLERLQTDYVDVFHLHGVSLSDYPYCAAELYLALSALRAEGKIRFLGITEAFIPDPQHRMLRRALEDDHWDVVMVGFNLLNQSARDRVLARTREKNIGVLDMFAVRRALSRPEALRTLMQDLADQGLVDPAGYDPEDPLGFLLENGGAESIPDAAYRFCRWEPGVHVVLSGTGSVEHLRENAASLDRPPLRDADVERLKTLFARVDSVSGN